MRLWLLVVLLAVRGISGLVVSGLFTFGGYVFVTAYVFPGVPGLALLTGTIVTAIGLFGGIGATLAWIHWDEPPGRNFLPALATTIAGVIGAWGGFAAGSPTEVGALISQIGVSASATGAALASNLAAAIIFLAGVLRRSARLNLKRGDGAL
jgi:hypothetical protein